MSFLPIKYSWRITVFALSFLSWSTLSWATDNTNVELANYKILLQYNESVRLEQVLIDAIQQDRLYQQKNTFNEGYRLFDISKQDEVDKLYNNVTQRLEKLSTDENYSSAAKQILEQLRTHQYGYRIITSLDVDNVRLDLSLNPKMSGNYYLALSKRPGVVHLAGLVTPESIAFSPYHNVTNYLEQSQISDNGNNSFAWVIAPDGHISKVGTAYWNNQHRHVIPGSTIFVGFNSNNSELNDLEKDIIALLTMVKS